MSKHDVAANRAQALSPNATVETEIIINVDYFSRRDGVMLQKRFKDQKGDMEKTKAVQPSLTALSSPKFPHLAKCALRLALELPAATPHKALSTLEKLNRSTLGAFGRAGLRQSSTIAVSLKTSAASLYILHSGSSEVPSLCAKRIVAILPMLSCNTDKSRAAVGEADASPTPTPEEVKLGRPSSSGYKKEIAPSNTALDDNSPAIELENAWRESCNRSVIKRTF